MQPFEPQIVRPNRRPGSLGRERGEVGDRRGAAEAEHGVDPVAGQRADPLGARRGPRPGPTGRPRFGHAGEAPRRLAEQVAAEVQDVDAQDHQVLAPAPSVLLAPPADLEDLADRPRRRSARLTRSYRGL